eukprot:CAMPEP_0113623928 /NCGR_PEP_ID=MMETSP0017_2-20120614/12328_1 /TAXON_ID=2856 /ORGANISM="Cylindrotheca closterium" /LENGTH=498 /DNA_ID=CAMNT_0000533929 /DNA_START=83 /DNA_END=1579 /DNA_ORIENTATION=- /assembly_acc=CAM_ASM_000147
MKLRMNAQVFLLLWSQIAVAFQLPSQQLHDRTVSISNVQQETIYYSSLNTQLYGLDVDNEEENEGKEESSNSFSRGRVRSRVKRLARKLIKRPLTTASEAIPMPSAIASILKDASLAAVEEVEDFIEQNNENDTTKSAALSEYNQVLVEVIENAFAPVEQSLEEIDRSLKIARETLEKAKEESLEAVEAIQVAAIAQAEGAATAVAEAERVAEDEVLGLIYNNAMADVDVSDLSFEDVDYDSSEMAPPFLDPNSCLIPGEPVVRVEKAPENSRRIFAGIDIMASVDDVWNVLTKYEELQNVIPNLVVNEVLELYNGEPANKVTYEKNVPEEVQCKQVADKMKGSLLKQVGGAKVAGINFSARTCLEVREWPQGLPDFAHYKDDMWEGISREDRARDNPNVKLKRYRFPRPFSLSSLPTKEISMQSIPDDDGEFRLYQGIWKMQPLPGCAQPGKDAMRLTYAVEISPRAYLPVGLVERRIVSDLCTNLEAIRKAVSKDE